MWSLEQIQNDKGNELQDIRVRGTWHDLRLMFEVLDGDGQREMRNDRVNFCDGCDHEDVEREI